MNQRVIAGLGNIAVSEVGWRAGVHPHRPCASIEDEEWSSLRGAIVDHIHYVLEVDAGDEIVYLSRADAENPFQCYGRRGEPCPRCSAAFERATLAGRATYFCPLCQEI